MTDELKKNDESASRDAAQAAAEGAVATEHTNGPTTAGMGAAASLEPEAAAARTEENAPEAAVDGAGEGAGENAAPAGSADEIATLRAELEALNDRYLRLAAEFDNYRKRTERERVELRARAQAELVGRILDSLDDLERVAAYSADATSVQALLEGVRLIEKKFRQTLEAAGLSAVEAEGAAFDPAVMEALMTVPAERPEDDDTVADVFQKGYRFGELLIRPARVRVRKYGAE